MSPGPSLVVVVRNTVKGGRSRGVITGLSHALGIVLYAFLTAIGIGVLITQSPFLFSGLRYAGAVFLLWLAFKALTTAPVIDSAANTSFGADAGSELSTLLANHTSSLGSRPMMKRLDAVRDGVLISILNPKIILFFLALFSQFVHPQTGWGEAVAIAATAGVIDAGWYVIVAVFISQSGIRRLMLSHIGMIEKLFGLLLIAIALQVLLQMPGGN